MGGRITTAFIFSNAPAVLRSRTAKELAARGVAADAGDIVHTSKRQEIKELIRAMREKKSLCGG